MMKCPDCGQDVAFSEIGDHTEAHERGDITPEDYRFARPVSCAVCNETHDTKGEVIACSEKHNNRRFFTWMSQAILDGEVDRIQVPTANGGWVVRKVVGSPKRGIVTVKSGKGTKDVPISRIRSVKSS